MLFLHIQVFDVNFWSSNRSFVLRKFWSWEVFGILILVKFGIIFFRRHVWLKYILKLQIHNILFMICVCVCVLEWRLQFFSKASPLCLDIQGDQKVSVHLAITVQVQLIVWRWPSQNTFAMWTVLYWTRSSRTQFGVSINLWRLAGGTLFEYYL
jgi:hypothetical protein